MEEKKNLYLWPERVDLIASDFDGTILKHGAQKVEEIYFDQIRALKERGICFLAASGRQYANLYRMMEPVQKEIYYICENGALLCRGDQILTLNEIPRETAFALIEDMERIPEGKIMISGSDALYFLKEEEAFGAVLRDKVGADVKFVDRYEQIPVPIIKMSMHWTTGIPEESSIFFREKYGTRLQVVDGGGGWLDFTGAGVSKGAALKELFKILHTDSSHTIAFGDSENDISMLENASMAVAMDTAKAPVKAVCSGECVYVRDVLAEYLENR